MNCKVCDGKGWYVCGETDKPEQVQCADCLGTGVAESEADSVSDRGKGLTPPIKPKSVESVVSPAGVEEEEEK